VQALVGRRFWHRAAPDAAPASPYDHPPHHATTPQEPTASLDRHAAPRFRVGLEPPRGPRPAATRPPCPTRRVQPPTPWPVPCATALPHPCTGQGHGPGPARAGTPPRPRHGDSTRAQGFCGSAAQTAPPREHGGAVLAGQPAVLRLTPRVVPTRAVGGSPPHCGGPAHDGEVPSRVEWGPHAWRDALLGGAGSPGRERFLGGFASRARGAQRPR